MLGAPVLALAATLVACGGGEKGTDKAATKTAPSMITVPVPRAEPDQPCNGRPGVDIPAVQIPAVRTAPVRVPDQKLAGDKVVGFVVPGLSIAAQRLPAQCATVDPAPAGCLGRITIPAAEIPAITLPSARIPGVRAGGASAPPVVVGPVQVGAARRDGVIQDQVCSQKTRPGDYQPSVYRPQAYRPQVYRRQAYRKQAYRAQLCAKGDCLPPVNVPPVNVAPVAIPPVAVDSAQLDGKQLPELRARCVRVFADQKSTAYQVCADVLFAFNKAELRASGKTALRQVAKSLKQRFAGRPIQVDGHTDSKGADAYNQGLSERRARAVARFLATQGIPASQIKERGYGETQPVAPNARPDGSDDPSGRRRNRRVVVGVAVR